MAAQNDRLYSPQSSVKPEQRTPEFLAAHEWIVPYEYVIELAKKARHKPVFLCGVASNEAALRGLFARTFVLSVDDATITHRLQTRTTNSWGKQPHELQQSLAANRDASERYRLLGYTIIDATQPLSTVADEIIVGALADRQ